jgi:hypothetical protein
LKNIFIMTTEKLVIGGILSAAAAIRIIITELIVPLAALLLTLAGWRPALSAAAAPAQAEEPRRRLALAPEPTPAPAPFITPRGVMEATTVPVLRIMARERGIGRDIYHSARKRDLINAILAATPNRGGTGRASG